MKQVLRVLVMSSLLPLLAPASLLAQGSELEGRPIKEIQIRSKVGVTEEFMIRTTGLEPGAPYAAGAVRESLDRLYKTGLFTDIVVEAEPVEEGVILRYIFVEKTFLASLIIRNNWEFSDTRILQALEIQIGEEFTEVRWKGAVSRLMAFYQRHGYFQVQVISDIRQEEGTGRIHVRVRMKEGARARIRETAFTGHKVFSDLRLWGLINSRDGEYYDAPEVEKDLQKLERFYQSRGYLKSVIGPPEVGYEPATNEVRLTIPIEAEIRLDVRFEGNRTFKHGLLESQLLFREERSYEDDVFEISADRLKEWYQAKGYPFVKTQWSREEKPEEGAITATFTIFEGPLACLDSITTQGNRYFSTKRLLKELALRPVNSPLYCRILDPVALKSGAEGVKFLYLEEGFLGIRVDPQLTYPEGTEKTIRTPLAVIVTIQEGIQTRVQEVLLTGNQVFEQTELMDKIEPSPGRPYSRAQARESADELQRFYNLRGFIYARVKLEERFSEDRTEVGLLYTIEEDHLVHLGRIFLEGNTYTHDDVILRELKIQSGDPYNEEKIQLSRHRILSLGYLGGVRFQPVTPISGEPKEYIKDMKLSVQELPPKAIEFGFGYGDEERFRGFVELSHTNIAGTGRSLRLRNDASAIERKSVLTYVEPWVFSIDMDARLTAFYQKLVREAYNISTLGGSAGVEKNLTAHIKSTLTYQIEFNNLTGLEPGTELTEEDAGRINVATINPSLFFDNRNDPFNPASGTLSGLTFRVGARSLGSEFQFRKTTVNSNWFIPLTRWAVLALSARGGMAVRFGESESVPLSERFFVGGRSTVRGYDQDRLGIVGETIAADTGNPTGGDAILITNLELRLSLPGRLGIVLFNDRGNVWLSYQDVRLDELKSTVGAGLRYNTPVGPLRLDVGYKLDREKDLCPICTETIEESRYVVHFTLGHAF